MAGHEWDWFQREELIGQISDIRVQNLQVERENVQKRTFTRWINLHLEKCKPPLEVKDLFIDIQDGKILMALLEVLSGQSLLHEYKSSSHRIFRLNNIAKALKFLEDSNVKLVSIDAAEIADGNSSLVLGLIWNIILFFQIKELTGNLNRNSSSSSLSSGTPVPDSDSSLPMTPKGENIVALTVKDQRKAIRTLLNWVQRRTRKYGVAVQDFAGSWRSGLAFLAIIKAIDPSLVDIKQALETPARENLEKAFSLAHDKLHIPRLLEPEDIMVESPDEQSIVTYVAQFLEHFPELEGEDFADPDKEIPIESTFVRIKETPTEQESKILLLPEKGEHTYTVNCETSQPPPPIIFVSDASEVGKELIPSECPSESSGHRRPDSPKNQLSHIAEQAFPGGLNKPSDINESVSEPSILLPKKAGHRPDSLPIKKTVHFESDISRDASCSKDISFKRDSGKINEPLKQDASVSSSGISNKTKAKEGRMKTLGSALNKILDDYPLTHKKNTVFSTSEVLPGTTERENVKTNKEDISPHSLEVKDQKLIQETLDEAAKFEEMTLKTLKQSTEIKGLTEVSQILHDKSSSPSEKNACDKVSEANVEQLTKKASKCRRKMKDSTTDKSDTDMHSSNGNIIDPSDHLSLASPDKDIYNYIWNLQEKHLMTELDSCEKAKQKSVHFDQEENTTPEDHLESQDDLDDEISTPLSSSISLETLGSQSEDSLDFKLSPPSSKVSVIPHDLFYYPHYDVPLSAVLEAYVEGSHGSQNEEMVPEKSTEDAQELDTKEKDPQKYCKSKPSYSVTEVRADVQQMDSPGHPSETQPSSKTIEANGHVEHKEKEPSYSGSVNSSQDFKNVGKLYISLEKLPEEASSNKKTEEWNHGDQSDSSPFVAAKAAHFSEDLEEEIIDRKVISRTSHSDSSLYVRRQSNRSSDMDHVSHGRLRPSDMEERRTRLLIRKVSNYGEAMLQDHGTHSDSFVHFAQQQDLVYFILFLWLLVYCLLLFPQLDIKKL